VFREETFGPLVPLFRFSDDDEAVMMANDTEYGGWEAGGGIWVGGWVGGKDAAVLLWQ
jgi:acyl-CoA reductase-like NAD-dependent aldehyde dehydrogenase